MTAIAASGILAQLKSATHGYHQRIGDNRYSAALLAGHMSRADYGAFLARFYGFYAPSEQAIAALSDWPLPALDRAQRAKLPLLAQDLAWLGESEVAQLPRCHALPPLETLPQVLGCMYVFEGSTLGGQLMLRQLSQTLGLSAAQGCAFFACYGSATGPMWKAFGAALEEYVGVFGQSEQIVASACATFEAMDHWLRA